MMAKFSRWVLLSNGILHVQTELSFHSCTVARNCGLLEIVQNNTCVTCSQGQVPQNDKTSCKACSSTEIVSSGICVSCPAGEYPNDVKTACSPVSMPGVGRKLYEFKEVVDPSLGSFKCPMTSTHAVFSSESFLWNWEVKFDNFDQRNVWLVGVTEEGFSSRSAFWVRYNYYTSDYTDRPGRKGFIEVYCKRWKGYTFQLELVGNFNPGEWISMTVSYDHATFTSNFFINGQQVPTEDNLQDCPCEGCTGPPCIYKNKDGYVPSQNGRLYIAKALDCNHGTFQGQVRNFSWYDFKGA